MFGILGLDPNRAKWSSSWIWVVWELRKALKLKLYLIWDEMRVILLTNPGEGIIRPELGCGITLKTAEKIQVG